MGVMYYIIIINVGQRHIGLNLELISSVIVTTYIECFRILYDDHVSARGCQCMVVPMLLSSPQEVCPRFAYYRGLV